MKTNLIIDIFAGFITLSVFAGDDLKKLKKAQAKTNWAMVDLWFVSNLSTSSDTPKTQRNQKKTDEKFIDYTRATIRKELALEEKILGNRKRAKL